MNISDSDIRYVEKLIDIIEDREIHSFKELARRAYKISNEEEGGNYEYLKVLLNYTDFFRAYLI